MLKEISNSEDVLEVAGEYTGGIGGIILYLHKSSSELICLFLCF
jgi:hypothetical protein